MHRLPTLLRPPRALPYLALALTLILASGPALAQDDDNELGPPVSLVPRIAAEELAPLEEEEQAVEDDEEEQDTELDELCENDDE